MKYTGFAFLGTNTKTMNATAEVTDSLAGIIEETKNALAKEGEEQRREAAARAEPGSGRRPRPGGSRLDGRSRRGGAAA